MKVETFKVGDKIMFLGTGFTLYDPVSELELYAGLTSGKIYTVKEVLIVSLKLEEQEGIYLKDHFRKIEHEK